MIRDIRELMDKDFTPRVREIENVQLGDVPSQTVQDVIESGKAKPRNRSKISIVTPAKGEK